MPIFKRANNDRELIPPEGVLWGVPRKEGSSDTDDPLVHVGVVQHAFVLGQDDQAVCGYKTPRYATTGDKTPRPRLALAGRDNPKCRKCSLAVALAPGHLEDEHMADSVLVAEAVAEAADEILLLVPVDGAAELVGDGEVAAESVDADLIQAADTAVR